MQLLSIMQHPKPLHDGDAQSPRRAFAGTTRIGGGTRRARRRNFAPAALTTTYLIAAAHLLGRSDAASVTAAPAAAAFAVPAPVLDFALGAVSGAAGTVAAYPFDYVKSQLQSDDGPEPRYRDGTDCLVRTVTEEGGGIGRLYRGCVPYVAGLTPEKAIKLSVNDWTLAAVAAHLAAADGGVMGDGTVPLWGQILAGSVAGLCQFTITTPLELVKLGMQTQDAAPLDVIRNAGGVRGLYRGADATIARDVTFTAILFPAKVALIASFCGAMNHGDPSLLAEFLAASVASVAASVAATPADCVKTRMQAERLAAGAAAASDMAAQMSSGGSSAEAVRGRMTATASVGVGVGAAAAASTAEMAVPMGGGGGRGPPVAEGAASAVAETAPVRIEPPPRERGMLEVGADIVSREGPGALFTGVTQRCLGSVPRFGVTLTMFTYLKHLAADCGYL